MTEDVCFQQSKALHENTATGERRLNPGKEFLTFRSEGIHVNMWQKEQGSSPFMHGRWRIPGTLRSHMKV